MQSPSNLSSEPEFQRLLSRIRSRYAICCEKLTIGSQEYDFTRVRDPDHVLEQFERSAGQLENLSGNLPKRGGQAHLAPKTPQNEPVPGGFRRGSKTSQPPWQPYWAEAWESAVVLASELAQQNLSGRSVLDLGCGLGLVGTVAASLGGQVLMVDAAPPSLLFARINSWPWRENVAVKRIDWRHDELAKSFSLIAGSDIVYDRAEWPHLEGFWRTHLNVGGSVLLAEPGRSTGDEFITWIADRGWKLREIACRTTLSEKARVIELQSE